MHVDYLFSEDGRVHAINCQQEAASLEVGILCLVSFHGDTATICNDNHRFLVEVPPECRSSSERVKAFNVTLNILSHEQV
jgi:hypothetical protein